MEKRPCIGIDASRANKAEKTGVEWYALHLIQEFKKIIPSEYRVILYSAERLESELAELPPNWENKIIKGVNLGRGPWLWTQLGLTLEMIKSAPDILFVPSHAIPLIHPKRTYTTIHDIGFEVFPESYSFFARLYHRFSARFALYSATKIFTPSEFTKSELIKYYKADSKKIIVTPLGFDAEKYHPICHPRASGDPEKALDTRCPMLHSLDIGRNTSGVPKFEYHPYILFIGRIEKKKNVKRLIEAFLAFKKEVSPRVHNNNVTIQQCNNLKLIIVGSPGFGYEEIRATAENSALKDDVIFTGYIPSADLPAILAGASVYALPSLYEGFGIPILEAMASGVPVLTSDVASMPEVACKFSPPSDLQSERAQDARARVGLNPSPPEAGEGRERGNICGNPLEIRGNPKDCAAHLVDPTDTGAIKDGLKKILTDQVYRADLISKGLARTKDFSWESTAKKTLGPIISDIAPNQG